MHLRKTSQSHNVNVKTIYLFIWLKDKGKVRKKKEENLWHGNQMGNLIEFKSYDTYTYAYIKMRESVRLRKLKINIYFEWHTISI